MHDIALRTAALAATVFLLVVAGSGCSSSQPTQPDPEESLEPSGPSLSFLYTEANHGLTLYDARRSTSRRLVPGATAGPVRDVSNSDRYLAFTYRTPDSSHLALFDLESSELRRIDQRAGRVAYSVAWHPSENRLAFGHYRPTEDGGRGQGGIHVARANGSVRSVGCSAAVEVLDWLPGGTLAARADENLYLVSAADCETQASQDARRMHTISYAPDGGRMAFIHRELTYDREAGDYVPDSSLVLANSSGANGKTLFGNERAVRHLRWAPDASELAFDVQVEESGHRQIVIYNGQRTVFLVSPNKTRTDQVRPRWSPSGSRVAFTIRPNGRPRAAVRVKGQTRRLGPVDGAVWGWLDDRTLVIPGPDSLRIQSLSGTTRYTHPAPRSLIYVWRSRATS